MTDETLLLRQINPKLAHNGVPSRLNFASFGGNSKELSVDDGDMVTAQKSFEHATEVEKLSSIGVMAVSYIECSGVGLPAKNSETETNKAHAHIDFNGLSHGQVRAKSSVILGHALARDWQYQPDA